MIEDRDIVGLKCAVLSRTQTPSLIVILLHGYGANRLDLATVAQYLLNHPDLANNNVSQYLHCYAILESNFTNEI